MDLGFQIDLCNPFLPFLGHLAKDCIQERYKRIPCSYLNILFIIFTGNIEGQQVTERLIEKVQCH